MTPPPSATSLASGGRTQSSPCPLAAHSLQQRSMCTHWTRAQVRTIYAELRLGGEGDGYFVVVLQSMVLSMQLTKHTPKGRTLLVARMQQRSMCTH
jgi:hypothetical protein